jgi:hypothetical protein
MIDKLPVTCKQLARLLHLDDLADCGIAEPAAAKIHDAALAPGDI